MKAREALVVFERAKETGFCVSLRGFAECVGVVPSTIVNWKNNPEKELRGIEATKVQYVKEEVEKFEPEFVDWSSFRREAAKDIVCAIISAGMEQTDDNNQYFHTFESLAESAVKWADILIAKLKQE